MDVLMQSLKITLKYDELSAEQVYEIQRHLEQMPVAPRKIVVETGPVKRVEDL